MARCGQKGLLPVVGGHGGAEAAESFGDAIIEFLMELQRLAGSLGDGLPGHVVDCGAKAAGGDDDIGTVERAVNGGGDAIEVIAHRRHEENIDADVPEVAAQDKPS